MHVLIAQYFVPPTLEVWNCQCPVFSREPSGNPANNCETIGLITYGSWSVSTRFMNRRCFSKT